MEKIEEYANELFKHISNLFSEKSIILIGEIHGTSEIPRILACFFEKVLDVCEFDIFLEWPSSCQGTIDEFLNKGDWEILKSMPFFKEINDGRNSIEYIQLLEKIYELNRMGNKIRVFCIDPDFPLNQNARELEISKEIAKHLNLDKKTFIILGNVHASTNLIKWNDLTIKPVGCHLKERFNEVYSINLKPFSGSFYNLGVKQVSSDDVKKSYNYVLDIGHVSPAKIEDSNQKA